MIAPRAGSIDGLPGLPRVEVAKIRVFVDGDMPRGVYAFNADEGWAEVLVYGDDGRPLHNGEHLVVQRVFGKVEARVRQSRGARGRCARYE